MQEQLKSNEDGWIGIDVMLKFQRLTKICDNGDTILQALKDSAEKLIEVDLENKKIRRNPEKPLPEQVKLIITQYCKHNEERVEFHFPVDLEKIFSEHLISRNFFGKVICIS